MSRKRLFIRTKTAEHQHIAAALLGEEQIVSRDGCRKHLCGWLCSTCYSGYQNGQTIIGFTTHAFRCEPQYLIVPPEWWFMAFELEGQRVIRFVWFQDKGKAVELVESWAARFSEAPIRRLLF